MTPNLPAADEPRQATGKIGYSIREACEASSLSRSTIYNHIAAGRLQKRRVGGRTIIPAASLRGLIEGLVA